MERLIRTGHRTHCPHKGDASYFSVSNGRLRTTRYGATSSPTTRRRSRSIRLLSRTRSIRSIAAEHSLRDLDLGPDQDLRLGLQALKRVDLEIRTGEIFALLGPNGAGKTTLISIVCGIVTPTAGTVRVDGHDIVRDYRARAPKIGLVPQELHTDMFETRVGHGALQPRPVRPRAEPRAPREGAARPVAVGQAQRQDHDAVGRHEAARADRQGAGARAARSCSSTSRPPASTSSCAATCGRWCARLRESGVTIILTTHYIDEAEEMADRIGVDQQGRADRGRGEGRADEEARQEAAHAAPAGAAGGDSRRARPTGRSR